MTAPTETLAPPSGNLRNLLALLAVVVGLAAVFGLSLLWVVLGFVLMIFLHELGHFVAARAGGMKVTEFFLGFGPRIWSFRRGEVEYGVKAIPAGAYVRIIGMNNVDEVDPADEARTYRAQSFPRRFAVAVAGSTMHFLVALVLLFTLFVAYGAPDSSRWHVGDVASASAAADAGLQPGDRLVRVGDQPVGAFDGLRDIVGPLAGQTTSLTVVRDGRQLELPVTMGDRLSEEAAAAIPGTRAFDVITNVDGKPVKTFAEFTSSVQPGGTYTIMIRRDLSVCTVTTTIDQVPVGAPTLGVLGVSGSVEHERLSPPVAAWRSVTQFGTYGKLVVTGMGRFFTSGVSGFIGDTLHNRSSVTNIDGTNKAGAPIPTCARVDQDQQSNNNRLLSILGAGQVAKQSIDRNGLEGFLATMVAFNVTVGLLNLIPLLPFDGGHVVVAVYERLREIGRRGRRYHADVRKLMPVAYAVVAVFVTLGLMALVRDAVNPIG